MPSVQNSKQKKYNFPDTALLESTCRTLWAKLQGHGFRPEASALTRQRVATKMRKEEFWDWGSDESKKENMRDLEDWAIKLLRRNGQEPKGKKLKLSGPTMKPFPALSWVTLYDPDIRDLVAWVREVVFGTPAAPFDWEKHKDKHSERARSKAIKWAKAAFDEEAKSDQHFERKQWEENLNEFKWFQEFIRTKHATVESIEDARVVAGLKQACFLDLAEDAFLTLSSEGRTGWAAPVVLSDPQGDAILATKVHHGGKLAWFVKWTKFLADRTGWWSHQNAMDYVLTNIPPVQHRVTGRFSIPKQWLRVPGTSNPKCRFGARKITLEIHASATDDEVLAMFKKVREDNGLERHKLSPTGAALLELYALRPPPAYSWRDRLKQWESWCERHAELTTFAGANAERNMLKEWKRATEGAAWYPMVRTEPKSYLPAFISPPPEVELLDDD
jgi:hypothetical protein